MVGLVLHYILGCETCELHFYTMRLYYKLYYFINQKLTGSHNRAFAYFIVMLKHFWSICSCNYQKMVKRSFGKFLFHLIELYATELKRIACGKPTFACSFIVMCLS